MFFVKTRLYWILPHHWRSVRRFSTKTNCLSNFLQKFSRKSVFVTKKRKNRVFGNPFLAQKALVFTSFLIFRSSIFRGSKNDVFWHFFHHFFRFFGILFFKIGFAKTKHNFWVLFRCANKFILQIQNKFTSLSKINFLQLRCGNYFLENNFCCDEKFWCYDNLRLSEQFISFILVVAARLSGSDLPICSERPGDSRREVVSAEWDTSTAASQAWE